MILDRETYFSNSIVKRIFLFLKKYFYILFRFLGRPNWGRLEAGIKLEKEKKNLFLQEKETGELSCTSCQICVEICPTQCLEVVMPKNGAFPVAPKEFLFKEHQCLFCDLCTDVCPEDAIKFSSKGELRMQAMNDLVKIHANSLS